MNFRPMQIIMLSTAAMLLPAVLWGQAEPWSSPEMAQSTPSNQPQPPQSQQNTMPSMQDSVGNNGDRPQVTKDKMFLRQAAEGGLAEVQFGQLAAQKGGSDDVKAFGQKMVDDHGALNKDVADVADSVGVILPKRINKTDQEEYDKLNGLSGEAFDTEYLTLMVKAHHKDLREFRLEAADTQDPALREAVMKGQKTIHEHLMMVDSLAKSKGIVVPGHHGRPAPPPPPTE
ncbi:MAG: DUF4142 domain-containing protein [Granulicella sp.]